MSGLDPGMALAIAVVIFFVVAAGVLVVLWIALPFSVFGVKGHIERLAEEQAETNRLLREIKGALEAGKAPGREGRDQGPDF